MNKKMIRIVAVALMLVALLCSGCSEKQSQELISVTQMNDESYTIGVLPASTATRVTPEMLPKAQLKYFRIYADGFLAVRTGKIDAFSFDRNLMDFSITNGLTGVKTLPDNLGEISQVGIGISQKSSIPDLQRKINDALSVMREDGTLDGMFDRWVRRADNTMPNIPKPENPTITLTVGTTGLVQPFTYFEGEQVTGYDLELAGRLGLALNAEVKIKIYDYVGFPIAIETGAIDCMLANLNITDDYKKVMLFSTPLYPSETTMLVKNDLQLAGAPQGRFWEDLKNSFNDTFIIENRWKLVLNGLAVAMIISICSGILGWLLGFGICLLRCNKQHIVSMPTAWFIRIIQSTPIVVLLMILYYIVFIKLNLSAMVVSVIGFSISFSVYVAEIMRSGIEAVDKGQIEAAYAIGYSKAHAFRKITFPQAASHFLPVLKGEFISMVKMTSVVGYITVQDLTKVSDIIRSRTMEAFFPLIVTAALYFLVANLLTALLSWLEMGLDTKKRPRIVKGVVTK